MKPDTSFVLKSGHFHLLTTLPRSSLRELEYPKRCLELVKQPCWILADAAPPAPVADRRPTWQRRRGRARVPDESSRAFNAADATEECYGILRLKAIESSSDLRLVRLSWSAENDAITPRGLGGVKGLVGQCEQSLVGV